MTVSFRLTTTRVIIILIIAVIIGGLVFPFISWLIADQGIAATSGSDFCVSCHSMEPMEAAYLDDVHGGAGPYGVQVLCVECHLDHSSSANYFFSKVETGVHDIWIEYTQDTSQIDWEAKREHREEFVYETGCLHCHSQLQEATAGDNAAFIAHKPYFLGETSKTCVSCHEHVGHKDLSTHLGAAASVNE